jgi:hypothetical protein
MTRSEFFGRGGVAVVCIRAAVVTAVVRRDMEVVTAAILVVRWCVTFVEELSKMCISSTAIPS